MANEIEAEQHGRGRRHQNLYHADEGQNSERFTREDRAARDGSDHQAPERSLFSLAGPASTQTQDRREGDREPDDTRREHVVELRRVGKERSRRENRQKQGKEAGGGDDLTGRSLDGDVLLGDEKGLFE